MCGRRAHSQRSVATTFINKADDEECLLDLKYLLMEAKQRVPLVLQMIEGPEDAKFMANDGEKVACAVCGGMGHTIQMCPKLAKKAKMIQASHREYLRD